MIPLVAFAAGSALKAGADIWEGQTKAEGLEAQAAGLQRQAGAKVEEAQENRRQTLWNSMRYNEETRRLLATQREMFGRAGVTLEGNPELVLRQTATNRVLQRMEQVRTARWQTDALLTEAENLRIAANDTLDAARNARTAGWLNMAGDIFAAGAKLGEFV